MQNQKPRPERGSAQKESRVSEEKAGGAGGPMGDIQSALCIGEAAVSMAGG
jgi:hypothetical protein